MKKKLYQPLRESLLDDTHEIFLPQAKNTEQVTKDLIKSSDVIVAEVSLPSTGQGIELGWASAFGVPIICIQEKGSRRSNSLSFITDTFIEYENSKDMIDKLGSALESIGFD